MSVILLLFFSYSWSLKLHHLRVSAVKAVPDLHTPSQLILVCKCQVQQNIFADQLLSHLCQKVIISASRNLIYGLYPAVLPLQQILEQHR